MRLIPFFLKKKIENSMITSRDKKEILPIVPLNKNLKILKVSTNFGNLKIHNKTKILIIYSTNLKISLVKQKSLSLTPRCRSKVVTLN